MLGLDPLIRAQPTPPSGCRGFESRHANKSKAPHLVRYGAFDLRVDDGIRTHDTRNHNPVL